MTSPSPDAVKNTILAKIQGRDARIGIIGMGYVGLPLAKRYLDRGFSVTGFDSDPEKVRALRNGRSYLSHIDFADLKKASKSGKFTPTGDYALVQSVDVLIMCVPTPLGAHNEPDLQFIRSTIEDASPYLHRGHVICLESTTYPGTTEEEIVTRVRKLGFIPGEDIFIIYSPERENPGDMGIEAREVPKVVSGATPSCAEVGCALYREVVARVVPVSSLKVAEMTKLLENIYRAVNIGLVNELKMVADRMDIDIREVIDSAATKPFGFTPFYPGPGLGGHCIPIDPFYLTWKAREYGIHTRFIELSGEINTAMPRWVVDKTRNALNRRKKSLHGSKILICGVAYKKNIGDVRESPAIEIMQELLDFDAEVCFHDPYVSAIPKMRRYNLNMQSVCFSPEVIRRMDCVIIVADHDSIDYKMLRETASLIVDTRGRYREPGSNIIRA